MMNSCCYQSQAALQIELDSARFRATDAERREQQAMSDLQAERFSNRSHHELIGQLHQTLTSANAKNQELEAALAAQRFTLAQWILSQRGFIETAKQLAAESQKTLAEVDVLYKQHVAAVLANTSRHGNDPTSHPLLSEYAEKLKALLD